LRRSLAIQAGVIGVAGESGNAMLEISTTSTYSMNAVSANRLWHFMIFSGGKITSVFQTEQQ